MSSLRAIPERHPSVACLGVWLFGVASLLALLPGNASAAPGNAPAAKSAADRYDLAKGCYAVRSLALDRFITKSDGAYSASASSVAQAEPFFMEPPELGRYLFFGPAKDFLAAKGDGTVSPAAEPSPAAEWIVDESGEGFSITSVSQNKSLSAAGDGKLGLGGGGSSPLSWSTDAPNTPR